MRSAFLISVLCLGSFLAHAASDTDNELGQRVIVKWNNGGSQIQALTDRIDVPGGNSHGWGSGLEYYREIPAFRRSGNYTFSSSGIPCAGRL